MYIVAKLLRGQQASLGYSSLNIIGGQSLNGQLYIPHKVPSSKQYPYLASTSKMYADGRNRVPQSGTKLYMRMSRRSSVKEEKVH